MSERRVSALRNVVACVSCKLRPSGPSWTSRGWEKPTEAHNRAWEYAAKVRRSLGEAVENAARGELDWVSQVRAMVDVFACGLAAVDREMLRSVELAITAVDGDQLFSMGLTQEL